MEGGQLNFYKRYPADYAKKTARLTLAQHGAYTLLLDEVYLSEAGLPDDMPALYRLCRAMNKPEQDAVRMVVVQFFTMGGDGLRHNARAVAEITEASPALMAARTNGKKGGRPRTETQEKPSGLFKDNPTGSEKETQDEPRTNPARNLSQSSELREYKDKYGERESAREAEKLPNARASRLPPDWFLPDEWRQWAKTERPELDPERVAAKFRDHWHAKAGKDGRKLDWLATWRNWVRDERQQATRNGNHDTEPGWVRERRERMQQAAPYAAVRSTGNASKPIDVEAKNAPARIPG